MKWNRDNLTNESSIQNIHYINKEYSIGAWDYALKRISSPRYKR